MTETILQQAYQLLKSGETEEARKLFAPILQSNPKNVSAWLILARTYPDANIRTKVLQKALALNPEDDTIQKNLTQLQTQSLKLVSSGASTTQQTSPETLEFQKKSSQRAMTGISKPVLVIMIVAACFIGSILGVAGMWGFQQISSNRGNGTSGYQMAQPETLVSLPAEIAPTNDGFFLVQADQLLTLSPYKSNQRDFSNLVVVKNGKPVFAIKGENLPLGNLKLIGYIAGFGVDLDFNQTGATINRVFENSPAQHAGLQAGEIVITIDRESVKQPMIASYTPGHRDLFGPVESAVTLEVLNGTTKRTVDLPRTYVHLSDHPPSGSEDQNIPYKIESRDGYVLLYPTKDLDSGLYRFEFQIEEGPMYVNIVNEPTPSPTSPPVPIPSEKWLFVMDL